MRKVLAGNWKMFKNRAETTAFFKDIGSQLKSSAPRKIVAASPTLLETAVKAAEGTGIEIFAQNCHWAESGAFTGESSPAQLKDVGVRGTIVGHSERRQFFGDNDETVCKRAQAALAQKLAVIYCIGESLEQRNAGQTAALLRTQLKPVIEKILPALGDGDFTLAYEPIWAIGTGVTATPAQASEAHTLIADELKKAGFTRTAILYGGSVKPNNFKELASLPHVAGGLVGGASLAAADYLALHVCL